MGKQFLVVWFDARGDERRERFATREGADAHLSAVTRIDSCAHVIDLKQEEGNGWSQPPRSRAQAIRSLMEDAGMTSGEAAAHVRAFGTEAR